MPPDAPGAHVPAIESGNYGAELTDDRGQKSASRVSLVLQPRLAANAALRLDLHSQRRRQQFREVMKQRAAR
jgi:hypothetical protein